MNCFLYIIHSAKKDRFYTGISDDPHRRVGYHNSESKGFTQQHRPWKLVYSCRFDSKEEAQKAEQRVKAWKSKKMIRLLVEKKIDIRDCL